jgi:hypothetical protein
MKVKQALSKVRVMLEGTADELAAIKRGETIRDGHGAPWVVDSINADELTVVVLRSVEEVHAHMPRMPNAR